MILIDKEKVTHIEINGLIKTEYFWHDEFKEIRKLFGLFLVKEGYKSGFYDRSPTSWFYSRIPELCEGSININGFLYWKPLIKVYVNNKRVGIKYFDTIEQAKYFCKLEFPNVNYNLNN